MAKITKKKSPTKQKKIINNKKKSLNLVNSFEQFQMKDCRVILNRATTHHVNIKVNKNTLNFNGNMIKPSENKSNGITYNLTFNVKMNKLITDHCNVIKPSSKPFVPKTLAAQSDGAWRVAKKCQGNNNGKLKIGQFVITKMRSYAPWPGQIRTFSKNSKRAEIYFFGTDNTGMVDIHEIVDL